MNLQFLGIALGCNCISAGDQLVFRYYGSIYSDSRCWCALQNDELDGIMFWSSFGSKLTLVKKKSAQYTVSCVEQVNEATGEQTLIKKT